MATDNDISVPRSWAEMMAWRPEIPSIIDHWLKSIVLLIIQTHLQSDDQLGDLILGFMTSTHIDANDLMTLSYRDSHYGSQYFLRAIFERIVTLKYLSRNPNKVEGFLNYDAVDWEQILKGIRHLTGMKVGEPAWTNISTRAAEARKKNKQEKCSVCGNQRPTSWTTLNTKDMAEIVGMGHLYLNCYIFPSKLMHPTMWGARNRIRDDNPMYNTLNCLHELLVELILIHRRYFAGKYRTTPLAVAAIRDFLKIWTVSKTSFDGLLTMRHGQDESAVYYG
jgi:hypothetical protein